MQGTRTVDASRSPITRYVSRTLDCSQIRPTSSDGHGTCHRMSHACHAGSIHLDVDIEQDVVDLPHPWAVSTDDSFIQDLPLLL